MGGCSPVNVSRSPPSLHARAMGSPRHPSGSGLPGSVIWRPYSMVSADYDEYLEFFSILVPGAPSATGWRRPASATRSTSRTALWLPDCRPLHRQPPPLAAGQRHGRCPPPLDSARSGCLAALRRARAGHCVSGARDFAYRDELASLANDELLGAGRLPPLRFVPIVTRESRAGAYRPGSRR